MDEQNQHSSSTPKILGAAQAAAIRRAVREAVLAHARAGNPVAEWRDGQVVWVQPAEVFARLAQDESQPPATN
jgi:hypothetical protein